MQHIKHAVIAAAGFGSRLGMDMPKCLVEIGHRSLISYQLELLEDIPDVRIVIGFQEQKVMDYVRSIRKDVTFVRNPNYATTTNAYSVSLAVEHLKAPYLFVDGDLLISKQSYERFIHECESHQKSIIGVTKAKTEEAVFVDYCDKTKKVNAFQRFPKTSYEWCGIAYLNNIKISPNKGYVFNEFLDKVPLDAYELDVFEIDTPEDLNIAVKNFKDMGY